MSFFLCSSNQKVINRYAVKRGDFEHFEMVKLFSHFYASFFFFFFFLSEHI